MVTSRHFPQKVRFTFTDRLINLSLEVVEDLVEARYDPGPFLKPIINTDSLFKQIPQFLLSFLVDPDLIKKGREKTHFLL